MRRFITIFIFIFLQIPLWGIKAVSHPIKVTQPDGSTIEILCHGDEFFRYFTTLSGAPITKCPDGYYYYTEFKNNTQAITSKRVSESSIVPLGNSYSKYICPSEYIRSIREANFRESGMHEHTCTQSSDNFNKRILVIPVEFEDVKFFSPSTITSNFKELTDKVKAYYEYNIPGSIFDFTIAPKVTLHQKLAYYAANTTDESEGTMYDSNIRTMIVDVLSQLKGAIPFNSFDADADGYIDYIHFIHAGVNEAESANPDTFWPQTLNLAKSDISVAGKRISIVSITSELRASEGEEYAGIGNFCHEMGHFLGLPDLYDVDNDINGKSRGLWGTTSLMDSGNYNDNGMTPPYLNAIEREVLGTLEYTSISNIGTITLLPINLSNKGYRIETSNPGEYFLFECRQNTGNDRFIGGSGMLVYHIDNSLNVVHGIRASIRWRNNTINSCADHECADIVESMLRAESEKDIFFPGTALVTQITSDSNPGLISWNGIPLGLKVTNITLTGNEISFNISPDSSEPIINPSGLKIVPFQREADLIWKSDRNGTFHWTILWYEIGRGKGREAHEIFKETFYTERATLSGLKPGSSYSVSLYYQGNYNCSDTLSGTFTTDMETSEFPYIYKLSEKYSFGDTLRVSVANLSEETESIAWFIDGRKMDKNYIRLDKKGIRELKLVIVYKSDGSTETITKEICVE
ncbi:MAG: M6 family metalloprotease domain-containing protein [Bacteroidales bacterium]|nr:M6 family metalloprotease domain-containing protein [Bacteroidales bacterium]